MQTIIDYRSLISMSIAKGMCIRHCWNACSCHNVEYVVFTWVWILQEFTRSALDPESTSQIAVTSASQSQFCPADADAPAVPLLLVLP